MMASFLGHVLVVVRPSAEKKVFRSDAGGVVACVTNGEACRNGAKVEFPRGAVREDVSAGWALEPAISGALSDAGELPAGLGFVHLCPEAFHERAAGAVTAGPQRISVDSPSLVVRGAKTSGMGLPVTTAHSALHRDMVLDPVP